MKSVHFGFGKPFGFGQAPSVALNRRGNVVMVQEDANGRKQKKFYCVGRLSQATINWGSVKPAGSGVTPSVALNNDDIAVEVHKNAGHGALYCRAGKLGVDDEITWPNARSYAVGQNRARPVVALNDAGVVVEVHEVHKPRGVIWLEYGVGKVEKAGGEFFVDWSRQRVEGHPGDMPCIAINNRGTVVKVYRSGSGHSLYCSVGRVKGKTLTFQTPKKIVMPNKVHAHGHNPSVALTDDGLVIVVHREGRRRRVLELIGQVSADGESITWERWWYYDDGNFPSVATAGTMAVEFHEHEGEKELRFSTSIITDRASWMQDRLGTLGGKRLRDLVLPASHDAGMYHSGDPTNISRNQRLSILEQLRYGIRYFDLRVMLHPNNPEGELWIHHGGIGGPLLQTVLDDIAAFANEGHKELVILTFSVFKHINSNRYKELVRMVVATIGKWLVKSKPNGKRLADITLSEYVKEKTAILVVVDKDFAVHNPEKGLWVYRDWNRRNREGKLDPGDLCVHDSYSKTEDFEGMRTDQHNKFAGFEGLMERGDGEGRKPCDLFLLSWTLTPKSATTPWQLSRRANPSLGQDHRLGYPPANIPNRHGKIINLLFVDYVESARVTDVALFLNGERVTAADEAKPRAKATAGRRTG
jgi:hypothetical protein